MTKISKYVVQRAESLSFSIELSCTFPTKVPAWNNFPSVMSLMWKSKKIFLHPALIMLLNHIWVHLQKLGSENQNQNHNGRSFPANTYGPGLLVLCCSSYTVRKKWSSFWYRPHEWVLSGAPPPTHGKIRPANVAWYFLASRGPYCPVVVVCLICWQQKKSFPICCGKLSSTLYKLNFSGQKG